MEFPEENDEAPIVPKRGQILCRLGAGSYGTVYKLLNTDTGEIRALKTEFVRDIKRIQLKTEHEVYEAVGNRFGFVKCYNAIFGTKLSNFVLGRGDRSHIVHLIDFGLSKRYRDRETLKHIENGTSSGLVGTLRYMSLNVHRNKETARRDDLESLGYALVHMSRGNLPWMGIRAIDRKDRYERVFGMKRRTSIETLCSGSCSPFLLPFMRYVRELEFDERPDYQYLKDLVLSRMIEMRFRFDFNYDWLSEYANSKKFWKLQFWQRRKCG
ncbi:hypothetical protein ACOME3_001684 [Neoechinorhynchus agilis]